MTTVSAFDSARLPYTLELAARFNSPYDPYAWRNGQPFILIAVVKPGDDPAVDDDCGSMFRGSCRGRSAPPSPAAVPRCSTVAGRRSPPHRCTRPPIPPPQIP